MKRDLYWDTLKFILIYLVIYGHISNHYRGYGAVNMALFNFIYMFHMPLFVFISGRFSQIRDRVKYRQGIIRIAETYVVFQFIFSCVLSDRITIYAITVPSWHLWYLLALIYWRLIIYFLPQKLSKYRTRIIAGSIGISLIAGFIPISNQFAFQRTLAFLPFFFMGYYSTEFDIREYINRISRSFAIGTLLTTFFVLLFFIQYNLASMHHGCFTYGKEFTRALIGLAERGLFIPLATTISIMIMRLTPTNKTLAKWGGITMFIYIYHAFILQDLLHPLIEKGYIPNGVFYLFIYSIVITIILILLSKIRLLNILLNPISYWHKK